VIVGGGMLGTMHAWQALSRGDEVVQLECEVDARGSAVTVLVRPEAIVVTPSGTGDAIIVVATFQGATTRLRLLRDDSSEVLADVPSHRLGDLAAGFRVAVTVVEQPVILAETR
jgi:putative spermidine/putrescine transport system ATP-binding protein